MSSAMVEDDLARAISQRSVSKLSLSPSISQSSSVGSASRRNWASASFREVWSTQSDVFQKSGREDDEEELKWAAIERLPTYDRLKRGMLQHVLDNGSLGYQEIDVTNLGVQDKHHLMESLFKVMEEDNDRFLRRIRERTDR